jgi:colicin import membrane protein
VAADALDFRRHREPGLARSFLLALAVHAVLVAVMFVGVRWQSHRPEVVSVELWDQAPPPPPPPVAPPKPAPEPPKPVPEPPKPEPKIEKPQIVEKAPPPKPKPKPKPEAKPKPKPEAKPKPDPQFLKRMQEEAAREQAVLEEQNRAREAREAKARAAAAASKKALDVWVGKIRAAVRSRVIEPPGMTGNPEAVVFVALLPSGDVVPGSIRVRSSGNKAWDMAVERAVLAASPLPKPDQPGVFQRELELRVKPKDE